MSEELVVSTFADGVTTLRMNMPKRLNGWTLEMMGALKEAIRRADADEATGAIVLTGTDPYYSAGVNLSGTIKLAHPKKLHAQIVEHNEQLFDAFLSIRTPMLAAVNGPAIGACVTSATLVDGIIASEKATFSTPFARLGVPPEGCSSLLFARLMGEEAAQRMLGPEGWKPTGAEAVEVGLANWLAPHESLMEEAQKIAAGWAAEGKERSYRGDSSLEELRAVNARESREVADAFLGPAFLEGQYRFLRGKKKYVPAATFWLIWRSRRAWKRLL